MELKDVNTVNELLTANKERTDIDITLDTIDSMCPGATLELALTLVNKLYDFHARVAKRDDVRNPLAWSNDAGMLDVARNILNNIDL